MSKRWRGKPMADDECGVCSGYEDDVGHWHPTPKRSRAAVRAAMRIGSFPGELSVRVLHAGERLALAAPAQIKLESGEPLAENNSRSVTLPQGYHEVQAERGNRRTRLIVAPRQCYLPGNLRTWGWAVQLYALRSARSWGIGDLGDLRRLARWSARELGAGVLQINPLCAVAPVLPQQASPYFPTSRCFRNPLYICIDAVPGAAGDIDALTERGRQLNGMRAIDRNAVFRLKMRALRSLYASRRGDEPACSAYFNQQGAALERFAVYCALAKVYGGDWRRWPAGLRHPDARQVRRFAAEHAREVGFHKWLQWLLDEQFQRAAAEIRIIQDLPVGFDPGGADAWSWQDSLARGVHVGAPPDAFNPLGQNWGLEPFVPQRLRQTGYEPYIQSLRANLRHSGGLRIDHVMGLFRLFWIPKGCEAGQGCYVRCNAEELLDILALESNRARAVIIGEDLGTVEKGVRRELAARRILSYRVLWFETKPPRKYPELSLASVSTHDLPTIAGLWSGSDFADQQRIGLRPEARGYAAIRKRLRRMAGLKDDAEIGEVILRTHKLLAQATSRIVLGSMEDALAVRERPNMPGTISEWPNWSLALPVPFEKMKSDALARKVAAALADR